MTCSQATIASGTLGSKSFTDAPVTFTQTADTNNVHLMRSVGLGANRFVVDNATSQATSGGLGTFNLSEPTATYSYASYSGRGGNVAVGVQTFGLYGSATHMGLFGKDLVTGPSFDLRDEWGPISAPMLGLGSPAPTDGGTLTLSQVAPNGTFTAAVTPVPEPSSLAVAGCLSAAALVACRVRRRSQIHLV